VLDDRWTQQQNRRTGDRRRHRTSSPSSPSATTTAAATSTAVDGLAGRWTDANTTATGARTQVIEWIRRRRRHETILCVWTDGSDVCGLANVMDKDADTVVKEPNPPHPDPIPCLATVYDAVYKPWL